MTVKRTPSGWAVIDGDGKTVAEFPTHGAAWRWIDRHERRELHVSRRAAERTGLGVYHDHRPSDSRLAIDLDRLADRIEQLAFGTNMTSDEVFQLLQSERPGLTFHEYMRAGALACERLEAAAEAAATTLH